MNFDYNVPIYLQAAHSIKSRIAAGELHPGDRLPSNLDLAMEFCINPNTVQRVYRELESAGVTFTRRGIGTFVTEDESIVARIRQEMSAEITARFLQQMRALGLTPDEIQNTLRFALTGTDKEAKG